MRYSDFFDELGPKTLLYCFGSNRCQKVWVGGEGLRNIIYLTTSSKCTCYSYLKGHRCKHIKMKKNDFSFLRSGIFFEELNEAIRSLRRLFKLEEALQISDIVYRVNYFSLTLPGKTISGQVWDKLVLLVSAGSDKAALEINFNFERT